MGQTFVNIISLSIQDLSLYPRIHNTYWRWEIIHLPWANRLLSNLSHPQNLKEIRIPYSFLDQDRTSGVLVEYDNDKVKGDEYYLGRRQVVGWDDLDTLLASDHFPSLRAVHFAVVVHDNGSSEEYVLADFFIDLLPKLLPNLNKKGILKVTCTPEMGYMSREEMRAYHHHAMPVERKKNPRPGWMMPGSP
ncbi:hypothetical protein BDN72DRAFT_842555 [Pluteus cervinus]|uniref:Uncharacterized protein n=1 Tax=Pluteus cervinus TaxID=181527 RepID=A0ACD3APZ2_9AGAR|nr:hypothetical protein BDN72DRAFT_842555 [Pluteus cervinus]